jgi:Cu(I)/Ag(I) efflux system membrane protein CusA/SilA
MIAKIIEFSVKQRVLVVMTFVLIGLAAVYSFKEARVDAIPDIGENQQIVFTEWAGRSPKDVEEQVSYPLSVALQGVPGVKTIRASSAFGFSSISVIFNEDIEFYWSRSRLLEKLSTLGGTLPEGVNPKLGPDATGLGQIFWYTLENKEGASEKSSLAELRSLQDFFVRYHLQTVSGVSEVASVGGFVKEYQIDVDPRRLFAYDIHFTKLITAIQNSNSDVGAEVIEEGPREMVIRGLGFLESVEDIENTVVGVRENTPIRIKDVASVQIGPAFRRGAIDRNGQETVGGVVTMRFGENPQFVIEDVKKKIKDIQSGLPDHVEIVPFYDRTELIQKTLATVTDALAQEIIITVIVVLLFLLHFKSSILVSLTLPFGVGISFILMKVLGVESNVMSLSGMVIAIGSMVDMGIIMTENIHSELSENPDAKGKERLRIISQSAREVGPAIFTAVMTTIITFLPVFALTGAEGKLFTPLAWAKTLSMFGAVIVAVALIPALSTYFLKPPLKPIEKNKVSLKIVSIYRPVLTWVLEHRGLFLIAPLVLLLLGGFSYTRLGKEFMPSLNEGDLLYMPVTTYDVSMTKARELLSLTDKILVEHPLVVSAVGKLGRADTALDPAPIAMFETVVKLVDEEHWPKGMDIYDVMEKLDRDIQIPGLINSWDFPIQTRITMISSGIKTQLGVKIFGDNLKTLESLAQEVTNVVKEVPGAAGVYAQQISGKPYVEFDINRVAASRYGINVGEINKILQTAVGGMEIGQFFEGRERYPIRLRYKKDMRDDVERLKKVLVPSPLGHHIPIEQLAEVRIVTGPAVIPSENGMLRSLVQTNVRGRDVIGFVEEAREKVNNEIDLPKGYSIEWAGQYENEQRAKKRLMILFPLALIINLMILYWGMRNMVEGMMIFSAVPIASAGGLILLGVLDVNTSVAVWVGFLSLFGIAVDDGVVMMTYLRQDIRRKKPESFEVLKKAILEAGSRRIRPLIMTTTTTVVALMPVMWSQGTGSEIMQPMAIPTLGGMAVSFVSLFMIPVLFSYYYQRKIENPEPNNEIYT